MKKQLLDILVCPFDSSKLFLSQITSKNQKDSEYVNEAVLFCKKCSRWFPVSEGIPSILPDALRGDKDRSFLGRFKDDLPAEIVYQGLPINLNSLECYKIKKRCNNEDQKKIEEISARDKSVDQYDSHFSAYQYETELEMTLNSFHPGKEDIILDLGIGTGRFLEGYLDKCEQVIGLDFSFQSLLKAKSRFKQSFDKNVNLIQVDISLLPFKENVFDKAISTQVIQHLPSLELRRRTVSAIAKVLKYGGEFVCSATNYSLQKRFYERLGKVEFVKKETTIMDGRVYCFNFKAAELRNLFDPDFQVQEIHGIINWIPKLSKHLGRYRKNLDYLLARTTFSIWLGDLLLIRGKKC